MNYILQVLELLKNPVVREIITLVMQLLNKDGNVMGCDCPDDCEIDAAIEKLKG